MIYHEAKKLSCVPLPFAYLFITRWILLCQAAFMPLVFATITQSNPTAFLFTFSGTFLLWFLNSVADSLDSPFKKEARTLAPSEVQSELNVQLQELILQGWQSSPRVTIVRPQSMGQ